MRPLLVALILLGPLGSGLAYADSDGLYCVGPGYLAYQFGYNTSQSPTPHVFVISTEGPTGIPEPMTLELPRFQVDVMLCGADAIEMGAYNGAYHVALERDHRPASVAFRPAVNGVAPLDSGSKEYLAAQFQALGSEAGGQGDLTPMRVHLATKARGGEYILEIVPKVLLPKTRCKKSITSRVIETDGAGKVLHTRAIFQGEGTLECGD